MENIMRTPDKTINTSHTGALRKLISAGMLAFATISMGAVVSASEGNVPVATDSRIKTFVYSENDVYNIVTNYGYQSNVEFGIGEEVETVSVGDRVPFQIIPAGRRLFIRAITANARTNMTIVTNEHTYQFDLMSVPAPETPNEELVYVVRFFYPDDKKNLREASAISAMPVPPPAPVAAPPAPMEPAVSSAPIPAPVMSAPVAPPAAAPAPAMSAAPAATQPAASGVSAMTDNPANNYKYTFSGSDTITPLKIFDDGKVTYFKLRYTGTDMPGIYAIDYAGKQSLQSVHTQDEFITVNTVSPRFEIKQGEHVVYVYNEKLSRP